MKSKTRGNLAAIGLIVGSLPLSASIFIFLDMIAARQAGHPYGGDALGLLMMSLLAYAIAVISCLIGTLYFGIVFVKYKISPGVWKGIILAYSISQTIFPIIYFSRR